MKIRRKLSKLFIFALLFTMILQGAALAPLHTTVAHAADVNSSSSSALYEAEDGELGGDSEVWDDAGASGGLGAVLWTVGDSIEFNVSSPANRPGDLVVRYANGDGGANVAVRVYVNDQYVKTESFIPTGDWAAYADESAISVPLNEGSENKIRLELESDNPIVLDYFQIKLEPVGVSLTSDKPGNIFADNESVSFKLKITDFTYEDQDLSLGLKVTDYTGNTVYASDLSNQSLAAGGELEINPLVLPLTEHGVFNLKLTVSDSNGAVLSEQTASFSMVYPVNEARGTGDIFGAGTHFGQGVSVGPNLSLMAMAGFESVRDEMMWGAAESQKGELQFLPEWDTYVDQALENGIKPLIILDYGNDFYDGGGIPYTEEGLEAFAQYVTFIAEHLKGKVSEYEIWNEPNIDNFNPTGRSAEDYAEMLKVAYTALKAVDPDNVVIGGAIAGVDLSWFRKMMEAKGDGETAYGTRYMDAISIHPYSYPVSPEAGDLLGKLQGLKSLLGEYGDIKPIYITEMGWPTHIGDKGVTEEAAGAYAVRANVQAISAGGVAKFVWYDFQDDGIIPTEQEHHFGLIRARADAGQPFGAKLDYVAYSTLTNKLAGTAYVSSAKPDATLNLYKFHRDADGRDVLVVWNEFSPRTIGLKLGEGPFKVTDMLGNSVDYTTVGGVLNVNVSDDPIYIEGAIPESTSASPAFGIQNLKPKAVAGEVLPITINRSAAAAGLSGSLDLQLPDGWTLQGSSAFSAGTDPIVLKVMVPAGEQTKKFSLKIKVKSGADTLTDMVVQPTVVGPVDVALEPKPMDSNDWTRWNLNVNLTNNSSVSTIDGTVTIEEPAELATVKTFANIKPGQTGSIAIPIRQPNQALNQVKLKIDLSDGYSTEVQYPVSFLAAEHAATAPTIDGIMEDGEWSGAMRIDLDSADQVKEIADWGGAEDLSAQAYAKWDANNLYLAVDVADNVQSQTASGDGIWAGDSVQLAIDPARASGIGSMGYHEIGFALAADNTVQSWRWTATAGQQPGNFTGADTQIVRDETTKHTTYETAIPWSQLLSEGVAVQAGDRFGFSLLINDDDGAGRRGWIEYMSGIGNAKDPSQYGDLVLAPPPTQTPSTPSTPSTTPTTTPSELPYEIAKLPVLDDRGTATAQIGEEELKEALSHAMDADKGTKKVIVRLQRVEGADRYAVELPQSLLKTLDPAYVIEIASAQGIVTLPANRFGNSVGADAASVGIIIGAADDRQGKPTIELQATADGKPVNWSRRDTSVKVSIPYEPTAEELQAVESLTIVSIDADGQATPIPSGKYDAATHAMVFTTTHAGSYAVAYVQRTFADITKSWAQHAIETLAAKGIVNGTTDTAFTPSGKVTRADFVVMVVRALSLNADYESNFSDANSKSYYYDALGVARELGIIQGTGDGSFNPNTPIKREDVAVIAAKALKAAGLLKEESSGSLNRFADQSDISAYAAPSIASLADSGILQGTPSGDSYLMLPQKMLSREEAAKIVYELYLKS